MKKKAKKVTTKAAPAKKAVVKKPAEKDSYGFTVGSKSSAAIKMLAAGKSTGKDARKKFNTLSFGKLLADLLKRGFEVQQDDQGKCSITVQPVKG